MAIKPDFIELASAEEKQEFVIQEYRKHRYDAFRGCSMDSVATYFSHMFNIKFTKTHWENVIWPEATRKGSNHG